MEDHGRGRCEWGHAGAEEPSMAAGASMTRGASQAAAIVDGAATEVLLPLIEVGSEDEHDEDDDGGAGPSMPACVIYPNARLRIVTLSIREAGLEEAGSRALQAGLNAYLYVMGWFPSHIQCDARCFNDPRSGNLKYHIGTHPEIMARLVGHKTFSRWMKRTRRRLFQAISLRIRHGADPDSQTLACIFCRSGKHLAVAASEVLKHLVRSLDGLVCLPTIHLSSAMQNPCNCSACRTAPGDGWSERRDEALRLAETMVLGGGVA